MQDIDFVISQIRPTESGIGLTPKGLTAVENILFSKYLMYKTVLLAQRCKDFHSPGEKGGGPGAFGGLPQT